jgi:hypothetical protein
MKGGNRPNNSLLRLTTLSWSVKEAAAARIRVRSFSMIPSSQNAHAPAASATESDPEGGADARDRVIRLLPGDLARHP